MSEPATSARVGGPGGPRKPRGELPEAEATRGLVVRRLELAPADIVYLKGLVEASEGLAALFARPSPLRLDGSGPAERVEVRLAAPPGRTRELDRLLADLEAELGATLVP